MNAYEQRNADYQRRATGLPLRHLDCHPRKHAGGTGRDVVAHLDALEAGIPAHEDAIARLQRDAEAVAGEHGHELGPWYQSEHLLTAAICTSCNRAVSLKVDGYGSNADPLAWLKAGPCVPAYRYYVVKSGRAHFVRDRERPAFAAVHMGSKAACNATAKRLNAPAVAPAADELAKAVAKVERARKALARAEDALSDVRARMVDASCDAPNVAQALLGACDADGSLDERAGELVVAHFSAPLRPLARPGSGFRKGKRGKR